MPFSSDPSATEGILGRDAAEDLAMDVISEMESEDAPVADAARVRRTLH